MKSYLVDFNRIFSVNSNNNFEMSQHVSGKIRQLQIVLFIKNIIWNVGNELSGKINSTMQ